MLADDDKNNIATKNLMGRWAMWCDVCGWKEKGKNRSKSPTYMPQESDLWSPGCSIQVIDHTYA